MARERKLPEKQNQILAEVKTHIKSDASQLNTSPSTSNRLLLLGRHLISAFDEGPSVLKGN